jgi:hypothetical protein
MSIHMMATFGGKMKRMVAIAALLVCGGCASKNVTLYYYPNVQSPDPFPAYAQRECAKFGLNAVQEFGALNWGGGRGYVTFRCEAAFGTPANPAPERIDLTPPDLPTSFLPDFLR